ncbi:hypothetical protein B566_EDAN017278 [Ephemera danica]|nr:hypothetical protein B566_EDAN017278 [Ephemera danica]
MKLLRAFKSIFIGIPVGVTIFDTIGYVARVDGVSMQPTLNPDDSPSSDIIFLNRLAVRSYNLHRGDIVSLISPKDSTQRLVKRVVGLEGDVIYTKRYKKPMVRIPKGQCWIEGDNSERSMDSNEFGPVALGLITAKASRIIWPPHRWQKLSETENPRGLFIY